MIAREEYICKFYHTGIFKSNLLTRDFRLFWGDNIIKQLCLSIKKIHKHASFKFGIFVLSEGI